MKKYGKRIFWTVCIVILCIADQQLGSRSGETQLIYRNVAMVVIGVMALSHYPFKSFLKPMYYVWAAVSVIGGTAIVMVGSSYTYYPMRLRWVVILGGVYGLLILRTAYALIREKITPTMNKWVLICFEALLVMVFCSRYDEQLSMMYLGCFGILYLTAFSREEKKDLGNAVIDGIIIGFFLIQGAAFVFRPYDILRYLGMYSNTNMNALMYQMAYCAFLGRFYLLEAGAERNGRKIIQVIWKWMCFVLAACMWGFVFLTMCRSAMLGMAVVTVIVWIRRLCLRRGRGIIALAGNTMVYLMIVILGLPAVYGAVRYIPTFFHHPLYFYEGYTEERVQSMDPWDSPKYVGWGEVVEQNLGRLADLLPRFGTDEEGQGEISWTAMEYAGGRPLLFMNKSVGITAFYRLWCFMATAGVAEDPEEVAEAFGIMENSTQIRLKIYSHYLANMNLRGHKEEEIGFWVDKTYYAPHAHNVFLQYAFQYGLVAGILLLILVGNMIKGLWKDNIPHLILYLSLMIFGLTEIMWRDGTLAYCIIYLMPMLTFNSRSDYEKIKGDGDSGNFKEGLLPN